MFSIVWVIYYNIYIFCSYVDSKTLLEKLFEQFLVFVWSRYLEWCKYVVYISLVAGDTGLEGEQGPPGPKGSQGITGDRGLPAIIALTNECSSQCAGENNVCTDTDLSFECGCGPGYDIESDGSCKGGWHLRNLYFSSRL